MYTLPSRTTIAVIASIGLSLLAGCDGDDQPSGPSPAPSTSILVTPTTTASTTAPSPTAAAESALAAYRGMWTSYAEALSIPDPNYAALRSYAAGTALDHLVDGITRTKADGKKSTGAIVLSPVVDGPAPAASATSVNVRDCMNTADFLLVRIDGAPFQDTPGGMRLCTATVERQADGTWKVVTYALRGVGTC